MKKQLVSATKTYQPSYPDELLVDDKPNVGSYNLITSDAVARAISVDPGNVPPVESTDNGKVLTASYSEGTGSFEWATAPNELPSIGSNAGKVLAVNSGATGVEWVNFTSISVVAEMPAEPVSGVLYIVTGTGA